MVVCATSLFWLIFTLIISWCPVVVVVIKGGSEVEAGVDGWVRHAQTVTLKMAVCHC